MLLFLLPLLAAAEEEGPATPTDLGCAHEHTAATIYFFDSPIYTCLSAASHRVTGPAVVEVVCQDCGETVSAETVDSAEEIRPHSMKNGVCALCGYRQKVTPSTVVRDAPGERTLVAQPDASGRLVLTLSHQDLAALEKARVSVLLVRGAAGRVAVAVNVSEIFEKVSREGASLAVEMEEQGDDCLFTHLYLSGEEDLTDPGEAAASLRFYEDGGTRLLVALVPADGEDATETEAVWQEAGYWSVPYIREGTYRMVK